MCGQTSAFASRAAQASACAPWLQSAPPRHTAPSTSPSARRKYIRRAKRKPSSCGRSEKSAGSTGCSIDSPAVAKECDCKSGSAALHGPVSRLDVGRKALLGGPIFVLGHAHFLLDLIERPALLREPADALEEQRVVFFAVFEDLHRAGHPVPGNDVERVQALHRLRRGEDVGNGHDGPEVVDLVDDDAGRGEEYALLRQPHCGIRLAVDAL